MNSENIQYFAHSVAGASEEFWEPLETHLQRVAALAGTFAEVFGSREWGEIAGLWHDIGKYRPEFVRRIKGERLHAPHASVGAALADSHKLVPLAFVIAAHHTGLANQAIRQPNTPRPLIETVREGSAWLAEIRGHVPPALLTVDPPKLPAHIATVQSTLPQVFPTALALWIRMLFSALVDADRLATQEFYEPGCRERLLRSRTSLEELQARLDLHLDQLLPATPVDIWRRRVLDDCRAAAAKTQGVFSLTVPTGGGKTYSSMAFALRHAVRNRLRRVIVVAPFTSIIDQNAQVYRNILGDENVLEHHSNAGMGSDTEDPDESDLRRQASAENWDMPIVVTTAVQFFESLFSSSPSSCRKLHNIAHSVVVLDEAQKIPVEYLHCILDVMRELVRGYGCTFVLSTATQPALLRRKALQEGFETVREIVGDVVGLDRVLRRVHIEWPVPGHVSSFDEVAGRMAECHQVLAIVHRRADARTLAELLPPEGRFHLSTRMCPAHRRAVLAQIHDRLQNHLICRVVSTQLVEAGVDLDFPVVFRAMAGLDSLAQAAGRCNRNGQLRDAQGNVQLGRFVIFRAPTSPPAGILRKGLQIGEAMLAETPTLDLFSAEVQEQYFRRLYMSEDRDKWRIVPIQGCGHLATISDKFQMIHDEGQQSLVVSFSNDIDRVLDAFRRDANWATSRRLQQYAVQVRLDELELLHQARALEEIKGFGYVLTTPFTHLYHSAYGLLIGEDAVGDPRTLMC